MPTSISSSTLVRPVVSKNETMLINTINETDKETINDTSIGFAQQKNKRRYWGIF